MSFEIDDKTWVPQTTNEHAVAWMEGINALLEENNVRDEKGNIIKLSQNFASALYLQVLAGANRLAVNDQKLQRAINSFNLELCDDQQIENLLPIAAITRNPGSYSTLVLTVKASEDGVCTIPAGTKAPYGNVNFVVQTEAVLQPGTTQNIDTVCDTIGSFAVLAGEVTAFDVQIPNLDSVENKVSSVPGNNAETTDSLRRRIIRGLTIPYSIDGVKLALEELTGVNYARVYFNIYSTPLTLPGGVVLQPRHAYIVINGNSDKIAETYARYMNAETQNAPGASPSGSATTVAVLVTAGDAAAVVPEGTSFIFDGMTFESGAEVTIAAGETETITFTAVDVGAIVIPSGTITEFEEQIPNVTNITNNASVPGEDKTAYSQDYVTASGQIIPVKYDMSSNERVYVRITLAEGETAEPEIENQLKRDLIAASAGWELGQSITSLTTDTPFVDCTYTKVAYTEVSLDGVTWSDVVETPANSIPRVSDDTIIVQEYE